jgi:hypothetical protein
MLIAIDFQLFTTEVPPPVCGYDTSGCTLWEQAGQNRRYLLDCIAVTDRGVSTSLGNSLKHNP